MQFIDALISLLAASLSGLVLLVAGVFGISPLAPAAAPTEVAPVNGPVTGVPFPEVPTEATSSLQTTPSVVAISTPAVKTTPAPVKKEDPPPAPIKTRQQVESETRAAVVNVFCTVPINGGTRAISGSGVIIDGRGIVLTNAHLAQFFLLPEAECLVRTGSPALPNYKAALLYLPPAWIAANAAQINSNHASGTGESDFAFIYVTEPARPSVSLPSSFSALTMDIGQPALDAPVMLGAYPASFLGAEAITRDLYVSTVFTTIKKLYSFATGAGVELVSLGGSAVSQSGSSGGAVVYANSGVLTGIIVTSTLAATTAERDLRAITLHHIDRKLAEAGVGGLGALLSGNVAAKAAIFQHEVAPALTKQLEASQ